MLALLQHGYLWNWCVGFISACFSFLFFSFCYLIAQQKASHSQSINCRYTNHWVAFHLHRVSVYYGAMKRIIVAPSDGQAFLQLCDKGGCEVVPPAWTIGAISPAEKEHNSEPGQIMVSTVRLFSFICTRNVPGNGNVSLSIDSSGQILPWFSLSVVCCSLC